LIASLSSANTRAQSADKPSSDTLTVMTYNLRFASPNPPNAWPTRRRDARVIQQVSGHFRTQEGVYGQLKDIAADLPDYE